ncbi:Lipid A deacylase PagL [Andreprevotia sp. IGB-42]|uniref:acyloxyacyl hydrolase n=1 Tax=Andreprevotia sp. IGB-42 TaxID=2497473 RepID=UPI0013585A55|nr:acyloxyacyl hydrolase [Andreprevotia sp. IGB-42]KAF0814550.1 Lipid A deacylase PagL [Andreprevotia sp. IGB-42]
MKKSICLASLVTALAIPAALAAEQSTSGGLAPDRFDVAAGSLLRPDGGTSLSNVQLIAGWDLPWRWFESDNGALVTRLDLEAGYLNTQNGAVWSGTIAPVARYQWKSGSLCAPFVEASIGVAWFSNQHWRDGYGYDMGSRALFADRLGAGCKMGKQEIGIHVMHYSNAELADKNPGADLVYLRYGYVF